MKKLLPAMLALMLASCSSSGTQETTSQDSTSVADTVSVAMEESTEASAASEAGLESGALGSGYRTHLYSGEGWEALDAEYELAKNEIDSLTSSLHRITVSISGYEASASQIWLFTSDMEPRFFSQEYSVEGSEGTTEYFIDGGLVVCAIVIEGSSNQKWCMSTNGWQGYEEGNENTELSATFAEYQNQALKQYKDELFTLFSLDLVNEEGNEVTLRYEATENYGDNESKTVTEVTMPKVLYNSLKK